MDPNVTGLSVLSQVLDASALRHRVISQNVANINTPGYKRLAVSFEGDLARALAAPAGMVSVKPKVVVAEGGPERVDGNTVDIDREMNDLTRNSLLYEAAAQVLASRLATMRSAITGR